MRSRAVSEHWRVESRDLTVEDFFRDLPDTPFVFFYGEGRWLMLAEDPLTEADGVAFDFERRGSLPPILPDLFGHVTFEYGYGLDPALTVPRAVNDGLPERRFQLHRRLRLYDRHERKLYFAERHAERTLEPLRHRLGQGAFSATKLRDSDSAAAYEAKVARIREEIARGNVYQVNLTRQEEWRVTGDIAAFAQRLHHLNAAPYSALVADTKGSIVSSSPECFFRIENGWLRTRPIKGTAPRSADPSEDVRWREELKASPKNLSELAMIVDLLRNDLTRVCVIPSVRVNAFPLLESYANVHHLVADLAGTLPTGTSLDDVLTALFPGGSITGCPKLAAMALIQELEVWPRRIYTGALGWCRADFTQGEFAIPIRTAWVLGDRLRFGVGGGVVWDSNPREEYEETLHKGRSLVQCLS
ncbi:MAG: anthranilate synthase component I family protein [Firmicutes bacterium]|nr:anthranilate synthase component I family protein [Bacillota bacterium]